MNSLGNVNASLNTLRAENTNALVHMNVELNVFNKKLVEPPPEYAGVGQHLAPQRRSEAQDGVRHTIARELGILFKDRAILPATPNLIKAYGSRASEIARSSQANPRGTDAHGPFSGMIGADATTLWAAATSGWAAIQCHLLACMLARIWEPSEATSIWVEIVTRRKAELKLRLAEEGELDRGLLLTLDKEISRQDLRDWDASARAWLQVGDLVMVKQQTQARLIIDNLHLPVNLKPDTYESVLDAWGSAMTQMEKLLNGTPLQVRGGDILLGLLSWHLYPDLRYLSVDDKNISQHDPLLEGRGILIIGLEPSPRVAKDPKSVYWALPLAHLRYYGRLPVTRHRSIRTSDRDRITVEEMLWAMVSAYILPWDDSSIPTKELLQFFSNTAIELHKACLFQQKDPSTETDLDALDNVRQSNRTKKPAKKPKDADDSWLMMLSRIALKFKDHIDEERVRKLRSMGQRFCTSFNGPFQSIFNVPIFLKAATNTEDKIKLLREIAQSMSSRQGKPQDYEFIIAYVQPYPIVCSGSVDTVKHGFEIATAFPEYLFSGEGEERCDSRSHRRWLIVKPNDLKNDIVSSVASQIAALGLYAADEDQTNDVETETRLKGAIEARFSRFESIMGLGEKVHYLNDVFPRFVVHQRVEQLRGENVVVVQKTERLRRQRRYHDRTIINYDGETENGVKEEAENCVKEETKNRLKEEAANYVKEENCVTMITKEGPSQRGIRYDVVVGDLDTIALLRRRRTVPPLVHQASRRSRQAQEDLTPTYHMDIQKIVQLFQPETVDFARCASQLQLNGADTASLLGMTFIEELYKNMEGATILVRAVEFNLRGALWLDSAIKMLTPRPKGYGILDEDRGIPLIRPKDVGAATCFACIAMMETGSYNMNPDELDSVFAICASESLYVASALLRDPADQNPSSVIQRFTGNIGRAGMAFMVPPSDPDIRSYEHIDEWYQYDHKEFDGTMENCFEGTSLHLSFSEATQAMNIGFSGGRDVEAYFLETLISVHHRATWIAELDILGAMQSSKLIRRYLGVKPCQCNDAAARGRSIISIDNFAEMIVPPRQPGIVRAIGNWQARLAAASLCLAKDYKVILKPEQTCWGCLSKKSVDGVTVESFLSSKGSTVIIL